METKEGKWEGRDDWQNLAWKVARRLKKLPYRSLFLLSPSCSPWPAPLPNWETKGDKSNFDYRNKIDWFRRSGFGDLIGLKRFRQSSLFFSSSLLGVCSQDDLKTVFRKIHTQMINRYRSDVVFLESENITNISYIRSGLSGKYYSPFSSQTRAWIDGIHLELTDFELMYTFDFFQLCISRDRFIRSLLLFLNVKIRGKDGKSKSNQKTQDCK